MLTLVEDHPNGYPKLSALMASHDGFFVFRRFSNVRTRLLLLAQDRLAQLGAKLDRVDKENSNRYSWHPLAGTETRSDRPSW